MIEEKADLKIRYSQDCHILAERIHLVCMCRLSPATIRRLFGFIKGTKAVSVQTLDVISNFVGYPSFDELVESFNEDRDKLRITRELRLTELRKGERIKYTCQPNVLISFVCLGKQVFKVDKAKNSVLNKGDT